MRVSVIFETAAIVPPGSSEAWNLPYFNLVILGKTTLSPDAFLTTLKQIESKLGRDLNAPRWSPRVIDLDILAWGQQVISHEKLTIPHRELIHRPFLLQLMAFLQPEWRYPVTDCAYSNQSLVEILHRIKTDHSFVRSLVPYPQMVGILNVTPDSFSDGGSHYNSQAAIQRIKELTCQGAAVIDIGAQSTRPQARSVSPAEEWDRLEPIFDYLSEMFIWQPSKPSISLDSFNTEVIQKALQRYPINWINDVQGNEDPRFLELVAEAKCKIVINHSLGIPPSETNILPFDRKPIETIYKWAESKIEKFRQYCIEKDKIIVDPGIGFGKSAHQSLSILRDIGLLKRLGCEMLVGHSRKSFLNVISKQPSSQRDLETIGISQHLCKQGVDYLRVHDVDAHHRSLTALALLEN